MSASRRRKAVPLHRNRAVISRAITAKKTALGGADRLGQPGQDGRAPLEGQRDWLLDQVRTRPETTLKGLQALLAERGVAVNHDTIWRFLRACGLSFKKRRWSPDERNRPDVRRRRERWQRHQGRIDPKRLVFIDETWVKTNMAALRGWAPKGGTVAGRGSVRALNTSTFIAALRHDRIDAPWVFDGPVNGDIFRTCVEKVLAPTLQRGDVVVMDNLGSHKSEAVRRAIRTAGAHLLLLPPYSPDFNPCMDGSCGSRVSDRVW
ncbi:IS630 family transposase [Chelativorans sp. M5D2P16]|uniref:IS630 family transposase n=1 Tax=Chelativorans sp. M5D2P16 TaxID=3095678 RepID=UPI002ACA957E|nr:IS630 family transposase [Chelativorans sp. M5D2P16]MDZ5697462.1 IS630 family transposase [Chelativorans sp. M5D2P16]